MIIFIKSKIKNLRFFISLKLYSPNETVSVLYFHTTFAVLFWNTISIFFNRYPKCFYSS